MFFNMKIIIKVINIIFLFLFLNSVVFGQNNYELLKKYIKSDDFSNAAKTLQKILAKEDLPDLKAWIKCGDIYLESRKYYSALHFYASAQSKFEIMSEALNLEDIGIDEDQMESTINNKIKAIYDALKLPASVPFFRDDKEQIMPEDKYYMYLAETSVIPNDSIVRLLPQPYINSELSSTIESHLEESADLQGAQNGDENGTDNNNEEEYVEPKSFTEVDVDPFIDLEKLHKSIVYPSSARTKKIEGVVILNVLVDEEGTPVKCEVVRTENSVLNQAAIDAVMKSKFKPALINNEAVSCWIDIPVEFKL
jgi:TonB family protein